MGRAPARRDLNPSTRASPPKGAARPGPPQKRPRARGRSRAGAARAGWSHARTCRWGSLHIPGTRPSPAGQLSGGPHPPGCPSDPLLPHTSARPEWLASAAGALASSGRPAAPPCPAALPRLDCLPCADRRWRAGRRWKDQLISRNCRRGARRVAVSGRRRDASGRRVADNARAARVVVYGTAPHIARCEGPGERAAVRLDLEAQRVDDQPAQRRFPGETGAVPRFGHAGAGVGAGGGWLREGGPAPPARLLAPRKPRLEGSGTRAREPDSGHQMEAKANGCYLSPRSVESHRRCRRILSTASRFPACLCHC